MAKTQEEKSAILDKYFKAVSELSHLRVGDPGYDSAVDRYNKCADAYVAAITGTHPQTAGRAKFHPRTRVHPRMKVGVKTTKSESKPEPQPGSDD